MVSNWDLGAASKEKPEQLWLLWPTSHSAGSLGVAHRANQHGVVWAFCPFEVLLLPCAITPLGLFLSFNELGHQFGFALVVPQGAQGASSLGVFQAK